MGTGFFTWRLSTRTLLSHLDVLLITILQETATRPQNSDKDTLGARAEIPMISTVYPCLFASVLVSLHDDSCYYLVVYSITVGFSPTLYCWLNLFYHHWGTRWNAMKRFRLCSLLCSHPSVLTIFTPVWRILRRFRYAFRFFFKPFIKKSQHN